MLRSNDTPLVGYLKKHIEHGVVVQIQNLFFFFYFLYFESFKFSSDVVIWKII